MARSPDHFRASDVTMWGIVALCCWGGAVLLANVSAALPPGMLSSLHASRLEGATISQLRTQVAALTGETQRMRSENNLLVARFDRSEQASKEVLRRVGALEVSLPAALEARTEAASPGIDTMPTASIGGETPETFDTEGGSVSVVRKPLLPQRQVALDSAPPVAAADSEAFALALGFAVPAEEAEAYWQEYQAKVGTLLIGLAPLLRPGEGEDGVRIVAGPIADGAQASQLCTQLDRVGIPCEPTRFTGDPLSPLN